MPPPPPPPARFISLLAPSTVFLPAVVCARLAVALVTGSQQTALAGASLAVALGQSSFLVTSSQGPLCSILVAIFARHQSDVRPTIVMS